MQVAEYPCPCSPPSTSSATRAPPRPQAVSRMGLDRPLLRATPGLRFWRLLGTGRGRTMTPRPTCGAGRSSPSGTTRPRSTRFLAGSEIAARWRDVGRGRRTPCAWSPLRWHGAWGGARPARRRAAGARRAPGRSPILTRAAVRPARLLPFTARSRRRRATCWPGRACWRPSAWGSGRVARQATFSLWRSRATCAPTPTTAPAHREVVRRTREERWYREELFARFRPYGAEGTWDGRDPLRRAPRLAGERRGGDPQRGVDGGPDQEARRPPSRRRPRRRAGRRRQSAVSSMPVRSANTGPPVRACRPVMSPSRGPGPERRPQVEAAAHADERDAGEQQRHAGGRRVRAWR